MRQNSSTHTTEIVMDALKRSGIHVFPVTDEYAQQFIRQYDRAEKAQFRIISQNTLFSNAKNALENIRCEKAAPMQWLGLLTKAGGIKAGEDKWMGLSEWLGSQTEKSITRQEVMDYINAHLITLHEEQFSEMTKTRHFKELQQELQSLADKVDNNYQQADRDYEEFIKRMYEQYGDDYESEMSPKDCDEETQLLEERERWASGTNTEIAFNLMGEKYGWEFNDAFSLDDNYLTIDNEDAARKFIDNWTIDELRLEYTTKGLDNYHELAFWTENIESWGALDDVHFGEVGNGRCIGWVRFGEYMDKKTDERVLVIDEIQSARHQEGRKVGYQLTAKEMVPMVAEFTEVNNKKMAFQAQMREKYQSEFFGHYMTKDEMKQLGKFEDRLRELGKEANDNAGRIPGAPFEKNWHELCMKRMLAYAAENGYDKIAWTTGEQQADRYDLQRYISHIDIQTGQKDGKMDKQVTLIHKEAGATAFHLDEKGIISGLQGQLEKANGQHVSKLIGESLARKVMTTGWGEIGGENLAVGGDGIKNFYDRILPNFMNHYGKRWGTACESVTLPLNEKGIAFHSVNVTPAMKQSVMQGQPMFMKDRKGLVYGWTMDGNIYLTPRGMNAETGIHEYTHLWAEIMRQKDKKSWEHIKTLLKGTGIWEQVIRDRNSQNLHGDENRIASEVLARISGRENASKLEQVVHQVTDRNRSIKGLEQLKQALGKFWSWVGKHVFNIRQARSITDVTDRVLGDLLRGTRPEKPIKTGHVSDIQVKMFGQPPFQTPKLRCKIDDEQQSFVNLTRKEAETLLKEKDPQKRAEMQQDLIHKYFAGQLAPNKENGMKR